MSSTPDTDKSAEEPHLRPARRRRIFVLAVLVLLAAVVLWWRPWRQPITVVESVNPKDGAAMVWVPAGKFFRGEAITGGDLGYAYRNGGWRDALKTAWRAMRREGTRGDAPPRVVFLDGYWIYKYEVTVAQYRAFCQATGREMPPTPDWGWQDNHPIVNVSWDDAAAYAKWVSVSLPTEAQWEKAARGTDRRIYPWGDVFDWTRCAWQDNSTGPWPASSTEPAHYGVWPVGSFPKGASPYGAMDMAGNAQEWCADWYGENYYRTAPAHNPPGPGTGVGRVLRGSCWRGQPWNVLAVSREWNCSRSDDGDYGFRCVSFAPEP